MERTVTVTVPSQQPIEPTGATSTGATSAGATSAGATTAGATTAGATSAATPARSTRTAAHSRSSARTTVTSTTGPSIGQLAADASTQLSTIIRGEVELAKLELTASVKKAGIGAAMFAAAGVILAYALTFGLISLAEGIHSLGLWRWLSYLIVFAVLVIVGVVLVLVGIRLVKKVKSPERTIATTKDTVAYLKHPTRA